MEKDLAKKIVGEPPQPTEIVFRGLPIRFSEILSGHIWAWVEMHHANNPDTYLVNVRHIPRYESIHGRRYSYYASQN